MKIEKDAADARSRNDKKVHEVRYVSPMGIGRYLGVVHARPDEFSWNLFYGATCLARGSAKTERGALRIMNKEARRRGLHIAAKAAS